MADLLTQNVKLRWTDWWISVKFLIQCETWQCLEIFAMGLISSSLELIEDALDLVSRVVKNPVTFGIGALVIRRDIL